MDITEIRVKQVNDSTDRLKAYCSITIDGCFVVRDLKVIEGSSGLFVAMPSRKLSARCPSCRYKNHVRARYCNDCGKPLDESRTFRATDRNKLHADVAHPINTECRNFIQSRVIEEYQAECERAKQPGYRGSSYDDAFDDDASPYNQLVQELKTDQTGQPEPDHTGQASTVAREDMAEPAAQPAPARADSKEDDASGGGGDSFGAGLL